MTLRVIDVDPADTFYSVRNRLLQGEHGRAVLVLPPRCSLSLAGVDLILLRRLADRERLDIGLVTTDKTLAQQARAMGLPAFSSLGLAEHFRPGWWRAGRRSERVGFAPGEDHRPPERIDADEAANPWARRSRRLWLVVLLLSSVLLTGLIVGTAVYTLPYATVTLRPQTLPAQVIIEVTVDPAATEASGNIFPARVVQANQSWEAAGPTTDDIAADRQRAHALMLQGLRAAAPGLLAQRLAPGEQLAPTSVRIDVNEERFDEKDGGTLLTVQASLEGLAVDAADINRLAARELIRALPEGFAPQPESLRVEIDGLTGGPANQLNITAQGNGQARIDAAALATALRGQRIEDVLRYLDGLPAESTLQVGPSWWQSWFGRLPLRAEQLRVILLP